MPKLTDKAIKALKHPAKSYTILWDTDVIGFGIRVTAGAKTFIFNYRTRGGRLRRTKIGRFPEYSTEVARDVAKEYRHAVHGGGDPLGAWQSERDAPTFKKLADHYIEKHLPKKRASSAKTDRHTINKLMPTLGNLKVAEITFNDIDGIHHRITKRGKTYQANRVVALISKMFALAIKQGWRTDNPAKGIERNQEVKRTRYLSNDELARLTEALAAHSDQRAANAVRLLLLTGARSGEVLSMAWDQVDFETGTWTKPGATTKQKTTHVVPLSAPALQLLATMKDKSTSDFVFPGRNGNAHRVDLKKPWQAICEAAGLAIQVEKKDRRSGKAVLVWKTTLRVHDLRHSYASFLASAGLSLPTIGALLGHTQPGTTARYAHLHRDPLREATERVGAIVAGAGKPGAEVTELPRTQKHRK